MINFVTGGVFSFSGGPGGTTSAIDTTGANFIILSIGYFAGGTLTIADSKSNTWNTSAPEIDQASTSAHVLSYAYNAIVGAGHTFTIGGTTPFPTVAIAAFSGVQTSPDPIDQTSGDNPPLGTVCDFGTVTPSVDNELVVSGMSVYNTVTTLTVDSGFSTPVWADFSPGNYFGAAISYLIQTSAAAVDPIWTPGANVYCGGRNSTFKAGAVTVSTKTLAALGVG